MRPKFLADHNLNQLIIDWLFRDEPAAEFTRVLDVGLARAPDDQILAYAATASMIVVTNDVNTMIGFAVERMASGHPFAGLIVVRRRQPLRKVVESLQLIWTATEAEEWPGRIEFIPF